MTLSVKKLFRIGAICMLIIGVGHTVGHFIIAIKNKEANAARDKILSDMSSSFPEISILSMYQGFSLAMGSMLIFFGLLCLFIKQPDKKVLILTLLASVILVVLSFRYFPLPPKALSPIAFLAFATANIVFYRKREVDKTSSENI
jgi:uncharacterized membrane protein